MAKADEIKNLKAEVDSLTDQLKRALADYANLHKRVEVERESLILNANRRLLIDLLPIMDLLNKATENSNDPGLDFVKKEFEKLLTKYQVGKIDPVGENFDPNLHEAVTTEKGGETGLIAEVLQPGYEMGGQVLRPAMVKVYRDD